MHTHKAGLVNCGRRALETSASSMCPMRSQKVVTSSVDRVQWLCLANQNYDPQLMPRGWKAVCYAPADNIHVFVATTAALMKCLRWYDVEVCVQVVPRYS